MSKEKQLEEIANKDGQEQAVKEFAEKIIKKATTFYDENEYVDVDDIRKTLKEVIGEKENE